MLSGIRSVKFEIKAKVITQKIALRFPKSMRKSLKLRPIHPLKVAFLNNLNKIIEKMMIIIVIKCVSNDSIIINNNVRQNIKIR